MAKRQSNRNTSIVAPVRIDEEFSVSILRRKNRSVYYMQYRDPVTGNKISRSTGEATKRAAFRLAAKWEHELRNGEGDSPTRYSWANFRELYALEGLSGLADTTAAKVASVFNSFESIVNPKLLRSITEQVISGYAAKLRELGRAESTIKGHLGHLQAAFNWAAENRLIVSSPTIRMPKRAKKSKVMKGRPITGEELERMIGKIQETLYPENDDNPVAIKPDAAKVASWERILMGFWWSGLRLGEAMQLHWDDQSKIRPIDLDSAAPMLMIPGEHEKGNTDRLLPMAPEFAEFLRETPPEERSGYVFDPRPRRRRYGARLTSHHVGLTIGKFGKAAGVRVSDTKFASAHDLRRSFGERWSRRVLPQVLQEMMRHETIQTTLKYYVGQNAKRTAADIWAAYDSTRSLGDTLGDTVETDETKKRQNPSKNQGS